MKRIAFYLVLPICAIWSLPSYVINYHIVHRLKYPSPLRSFFHKYFYSHAYMTFSISSNKRQILCTILDFSISRYHYSRGNVEYTFHLLDRKSAIKLKIYNFLIKFIK